MTYVVHSTMVTGVWPDKHGVTHNHPLQPFVENRNQMWYWFRDDLKVPTIYDAVKEAGMKTAGILWPVTARSSIDFNMPEIVAINRENQAIKILKNGSPFFCIRMQLKYGHIRKGIAQPFLDDFSTTCAVDIIKRKKPNLLLLHLIDLDDTKHRYGTNSPEVHETVMRMDQRLGQIVNAVEEAGIGEDTVFIVIGDHGQINVNYRVHLNNLLEEQNLINGNMWRAYFQIIGGAAYLHIKPGDQEAEKTALAVLEKAIKMDEYGIESFFTRNELDGLHVDQSVKYMVEAKEGYCFVDSLSDRMIDDLGKLGISYATHGFSPDKESYKCNVVVSGKKIKNEYELSNMEMIDLAPTMAKILGIHFNCDGKSLDEIFDV